MSTYINCRCCFSVLESMEGTIQRLSRSSQVVAVLPISHQAPLRNTLVAATWASWLHNCIQTFHSRLTVFGACSWNPGALGWVIGLRALTKSHWDGMGPARFARWLGHHDVRGDRPDQQQRDRLSKSHVLPPSPIPFPFFSSCLLCYSR